MHITSYAHALHLYGLRMVLDIVLNKKFINSMKLTTNLLILKQSVSVFINKNIAKFNYCNC